MTNTVRIYKDGYPSLPRNKSVPTVAPQAPAVQQQPVVYVYVYIYIYIYIHTHTYTRCGLKLSPLGLPSGLLRVELWLKCCLALLSSPGFLLRDLNLSYHNEETMLFTIVPLRSLKIGNYSK